MKKQDKNTRYFNFYNVNPKGKIGSDCAVRSIAAYLGKSWEDVIREMTEVGLKYGYVLNDEHCIQRYLKAAGLKKMKEPRTIHNKKISVQEWLRINPQVSCIANVGSHHMTAILGGRVQDTWDCSNNTMHSYWVK